MAFIVPLIPYIAAAASVAGTVMSVRGQQQAANAQADYTQQTAQYYAVAKESEAAQYEEQSIAEFATAQRQAEEEKRKSRILQSRALAVAGASGAGVSDPTVFDIVSDLEGEGAYRAAVAMYEGGQRAEGARRAAAASRYEGATGLASGSASSASQRQAGKYAAMGTIFQGTGNLLTMYGKYGLPSTSTTGA
jgi:hypothetical protein